MLRLSRFQRPGCRLPHSAAKTDWLAEPKLGERRLVAREGSAPSISGCRPDVMLFHHRAKGARVSDPQHARNHGAPNYFKRWFTIVSAAAGTAALRKIWLPGLDSHQRSRLQRALSYELD